MPDRDLRRNMLEKLVWVSAFMLVGAVHGGITVGEVESKHREEVEALIRELACFCRFTLTVSLKTGLEARQKETPPETHTSPLSSKLTRAPSLQNSQEPPL